MKTSGKKKSFQIGTAFWIAAIAMGGRASGSITDHMIRARRPRRCAPHLELRRQRAQKARHDEDGRRQPDGRIGDDEAPAAVEKAEIPQQDEERDRELQGSIRPARKNSRMKVLVRDA